MKKIIFTLCLASSLSSIQAQNWLTTLNDGTGFKLGTKSNYPLNFFTNNTNYMTLTAEGILKLNNYTGSSSSILYIDQNGVVSRAPGMGSPGAPCVTSALPWAQGGNNSVYNNSIGTCDGTDFILKSNNMQSVFLTTAGYIGMGYNNSTPSSVVDISDGTIPSNVEHMRIYGDQYGTIESTTEMDLYYAPYTQFVINEGSLTNGVTTRFSMGGGVANMYNDFNVSGHIESYSNNASSIGLQVYNTSSNKSNFLVYNSGKTTIGPKTQVSPSTHTSAMLTVYGSIVGQEMVVTQQNWADYVFNTNYKLQSLESLEKYISQNKHLPNVPSAEEIKKDGENLGEMSKIQMEKIEELTLYVIELKKELDLLKKQVKNN